MQLKSMLCPIDFSDFSVAAYQYALSLAEYYKAKIVALHIVELWKFPFGSTTYRVIQLGPCPVLAIHT
jgi:hypothetical protein